MKEIVNGVLYDTATAQHLGEWRSSENPADPKYCVIALYRKPNGEFFLACCGNGKEHYVCYVRDDNVGRIKSIIPLAQEDASAWAEDYLSVDEYIAAFGEVTEDDGYKSTCLLLQSEVAAKAQEAASAIGIDFSRYIEKLIRADNQSA